MNKDYKKTNKNEINTNELDEIREMDTDTLNKVSGGVRPDIGKIDPSMLATVNDNASVRCFYGSPDFFGLKEEEGGKRRENTDKSSKDWDKNNEIRQLKYWQIFTYLPNFLYKKYLKKLTI